jgi:uncharacterized Zn-finger protein
MNAVKTENRVVEVTETDLPLHCPMPGQSTWDSHPRVFLDVEDTGEARCPYCGTLYKLKGGAGHRHH